MTIQLDQPEQYPEPHAFIWVCQGPPRCHLQGDEAVKAQESACIWCKQILVYPGGESTIEPSEC